MNKNRINIGAYTYGEPAVFGKTARCNIGKFCSIGDNVRIDIGHEHNPNNISTYPFNAMLPNIAGQCTTHPLCRGDVNIGNDVWIGFDTIILSGVTVGDGAIIGANSLVRDDVEPYSVTAGTPARLKRYRFIEELREKLLTMRWWDWPEKRLMRMEVMDMLMGNDVDKLWDYWTSWSQSYI